VEYRGIWVVFLTLLFLLGASVSLFPASVARFLRPKRDLPPLNSLKAWHVVGAIVAVGSLVKLVEVLSGAF